MKMNYKNKSCWVCKNITNPFMTFGPMPIANGIISKEQFTDLQLADII